MPTVRVHKTVGVKVGNVQIGGGAPVAVQSMTNTDTVDVDATARQCIELAQAGSELVRITVNIPEVDVQFLRVSPEKMPQFIDMVIGKRNAAADDEENEEGEGDYYDYWSNRNRLKGQTSGWQLNALQKMAESVYNGRFLTNDVPNSRKVSFLPVEKIAELKEPGIYVAVMSRPGFFDNDFQVTYFYVSDIGLHVRRQVKQTDVFTTGLKSGKALGGVDLEVLGAEGKSLLQGKTDSDGHGVLPGLPDGARLLLAKRGKETSIIALQEPGLDLAEFDIGGHLPRDAKLFAWAGRDLYRPGEKFTVSLMARNADGTALPPAPIKVDLKKPDGDVVNSTMWQPNAKTAGYLQQSIDLPPDAATGKWTLEFRADPSAKRPDTISQLALSGYTRYGVIWRALRGALLACTRRWAATPELATRAIQWLEARRLPRPSAGYGLALDYFYWAGALAALRENAAAGRRPASLAELRQ